MGLLIDGVWHDHGYDTKKNNGSFVRQDSKFRGWVTEDGSSGFKAESGRYHLYVSLACPWAHRTLIFRQLKNLTNHISVSVVHWRMLENGWTFEDGEGVIKDPVRDAEYLHQIYTTADSTCSGRVTVPILWDKQKSTIVSNESADIIRMFNDAFQRCGASDYDFYPLDKREEIDAINERIYANVNNGVYRCGFASSQEVYEQAIVPLFETLEWLDDLLHTRRYLVGSQITEADWRLFTTLVRFDAVYVGHFKCNTKRIFDFPYLSAYLRDLYQVTSVAETVNMDHIKKHYYESHRFINPSGVVPVGPELSLDVPHNRAALS